MLTSYDLILRKSTFGTSNSLGRAPINRLPPEILIGILSFVIDGQPRGLLDDNTFETLPMYPDLFSHVCSRWRQITLGFPTLWIEIELSLSESTWERFLTRAKLFVSRASQLPLDVCINNNIRKTVDEIDNTSFLSDIAPRIRSFRFNNHFEPHPAHNKLFQTIFPKCNPGILTEVTLLDIEDLYPLTFIQAIDDKPHGANDIVIPLPNNDLESLWLSVTSLRVGRIYPRWSSKAYHGLVELHLLAWSNDPPTISISEFTSILKSSPGLRILHIDLLVTEAELFSGDTPVRLEHLEILNLCRMEYADIEPLIRVITPGPKPLRFSFTGPDSEHLSSNPEVVKFFQRSNIEGLYIEDCRTDTLFEDIFQLAPHLHILAFEFLQLVELNLGGLRSELGKFCVPKALHTIYISRCSLTPENFRKLAELFPTQALRVWNCGLAQARTGPSTSMANSKLPIEEAQKQWDSIVSSRFKFVLSEGPSPIEGWGHML